MSVASAPRNFVVTYNGTQAQQTNVVDIEWTKPSTFGTKPFQRYDIRRYLLSEGKDGPNSFTRTNTNTSGPYAEELDIPFTGDWRIEVRAITEAGAGEWALKDIHVYYDAGIGE